MSCVASIRSPARWIGLPVIFARWPTHFSGVARRRVQAGADRRRPHVDLVQDALLHPFAAAASSPSSVGGEGLELLTERHRHRVLQLGASHLDDVDELLALGAEGRDQLAHRGDRLVVAQQQADLERDRIGVVRRLRHVAGRRAARSTGTRPSCGPMSSSARLAMHLVGVHVGRGAGAALVARRRGTGRGACRR